MALGKAYVGDHGKQQGLLDDDHTQYALLAGRATGQTLSGGTATAEDITIKGTAHGDNNGDIFLNPDGGFVGIGQTSPVSVLHVKDTTAPNIVLEGGNSNTLYLYGGTVALDTSLIRSASGKSLSFGANYQVGHIHILSSGYVGIGHTSPVVALDVAGTIKSSQGRICGTTRATTTYQILVTDHIVFCNTDGSSWTATLPAGAEGQTLRIINTGSSGETLTLAPTGAEHLIGANSNITLEDSEAIELTYNATDGWY